MCRLLFSDHDFAVPRELVGNNRVLVGAGWKNLLNQKPLTPFLLLAETRNDIESPVNNNCLERDYNLLARPRPTGVPTETSRDPKFKLFRVVGAFIPIAFVSRLDSDCDFLGFWKLPIPLCYRVPVF